MIKDIIKNLNLSSTLRINEISKELESKGKEVFKFGFGQSPFKVPENVITELKNNPQDSKNPMEDYHNYNELTSFLQNIATNYPNITKLESIGQSVQGRELWVMEISDNPGLNEIELIVLIDCCFNILIISINIAASPTFEALIILGI